MSTAISVLNADPVNHTGVIFSIIDPTVTITTQTISKSVTIQGATENADGSPNTIVFLQSGQTGRHFRVTGGNLINVAFKGLAIIGPNATYAINAGVGTASPTGGTTAGGGVESLGPTAYPGSISVENCVVAGCNTSALGGVSVHGGGINFTCSSAANYTQSYLKGVVVCAYNNAGAGGSGGGLYFAFGKNHIQTTSLLVKGNTATGVGGGIFVGGVTNPATTLICTADNHLVIDSNITNMGGGGIASDQFGDTINLTGATITNNKALSITTSITSGGGGIAARSALFLNNCTITGNTTGYIGGGVYAATNFVLNNTTISNNRAGYDITNSTWLTAGDGGGLYVNGNLTLQGNITFQNDTAANNGGAIYKGTTASSLISSSSDLILNINNNVARIGTGGGISTQLTADFSNAQTITINNNTAKSNGGGIYFNGGTLTLKNASISNNKAGYDVVAGGWITTGSANGGGIYSSLPFIPQGYLIVNNNEAYGALNSLGGGGIYQTATVNATNLTDSLIVNGNMVHNGTGGGIYVGGTLNLSACNKTNILNNMAKGSGGGIYAASGLTLRNATVTNNKAGYDVVTGKFIGTGTTPGYRGGGVYVTGNQLTLTGDIVFKKDSVSGSGINPNNPGGGAIYTDRALIADAASGLTSLLIDSCAVVNPTDGTSTNINTGVGGAIFVNSSGGVGGYMILKGSPTVSVAIRNNFSSSSGGGIFSNAISNGTTISYVTVSKNNAMNFSGGGIVADLGTSNFLNMDHSTVMNNNAGSAGGGVLISAGSSSTISNTQIIGNTAKNSGGGVYSTTSPLTMSKNFIAKNIAGYDVTNIAAPWQSTGDGGGVYANNSITLQDTIIFQKNTSTGNGGAIYKSSTGTFSATGLNLLEVTSNIARLGNGGAIFVQVAANFSPVQTFLIVNNVAKANGGAIYSTGGTLTLKNINISNHRAGYGYTNANDAMPSWQATGDGGAIYANNNIDLQGTIICQNDTAAGNGGAIYKSVTNSLTSSALISLNVSNNVARTGSGGGIYSAAATGGSITLDPGTGSITINNNIALGSGGGLYSTSGNLTLKNATVSNNKAGYDITTGSWLTTGTANGGGIYTSSPFFPQGYLVANNNEAFGSTVGSPTTGGGGMYIGPGAFTGTGFTDSLIVMGNIVRNGTNGGGGMYVSTAMNLSACSKIIISNNIAKGSGGGIFNTSALTLNKATISNNKAGYDNVTGSWITTGTANGGGLYCNTTLDFSGYLIVNNNEAFGGATNGGGGIYQASTMTAAALTDSLIINNNILHSGTGGGIYTSGATNLSASNKISISNNIAKGSGGGMYAGNTLSIKNATFSNNKSGYDNVAGSWITTGSANGGGLYGSTSTVLAGYLVVDNNEAYGGATGNTIGGGGICQVGGIVTATSLTDSLIITGNKVRNNVSSGGGIYTSVNMDFSACNKTIISNNIAIGTGGGIGATNAAPLLLKNAIITNNKAGYDVANMAAPWQLSGDGGGIYAGNTLSLQGTVTLQNDTAAANGGAIYKSASGSFDVSNLNSLTINTNTARNASGGGIYTAAILTLRNRNGVSLMYNTAATTGGGISSTATLELDSLSILYNTAGTQGGGVSATGEFTSIGNTFANNNAANGGGIYSANNLVITNNTFSQNTATNSGGALSANAATITTFSTFNGNSAATSGAAIFLNSILNKTFNGNIIYGNGSVPEMNIAPVVASYNIIRDMSLGGTNKTVSAGNGSSIFASITSGDLATLGNNGGPTQTLLIKKRGLAQNFIPLTAGISTSLDQRNLTRAVSCGYDAGSVELQQSELDSIVATFALKNPTTLCGNNPAYDLKNSILSTTYTKDTLYFSDAAHTTPIPKPAIVNITGNVTIYVQFIDSSNCTKDTSFLISVQPLPITSIIGNSTVCLSDTATYTTADAMSLYAWEIVGAGGNFTSDTTLQTVKVVWTSAGSRQLKVTFTNANGCQNSATSNILVNALPEAIISDNSSQICQGDQEELTISLTSGNSSTWSVVLGVFVNDVETEVISTGFTNTSATTKTIVVSPLVDTVYKIKSITDGNGCTKVY